MLALILSRLELSQINSERFSDESGRVYVIYTVEEVCEKFGCSPGKTVRAFKELEKSGMIERYRKNRLTPYRIYITDAFYDILKSEVTNVQNGKSRVCKTESHECSKPEDIYNEYIYNNNIKNKSSIIVTDDEIRERIEYDCLYCEENAGMLDELVMIISDVLNGVSPTVRIGKDELPRSLVVSRFDKIDSENIVSVLWQLNRNKTKIKNMRAYLRMMLYNDVETSECEETAALAEFKARYGID